MTFDQITQDLKAKKYHPVYFLHGDESYYIDLLAHQFEHQILDEAERAFNLTILYGKEVDHKTVIDAARRFPMMAPHQVVILKEAQSMKTIADLSLYIENPSLSTLFIICYKHARFDKRTKFAKLIIKKAVIFESKRIYDNQIPAWINNYLQKKGLKINNKETSLIGEYLGNNLNKIANELDKLAINLTRGHQITQDDIEKYIGISKDYNIFELQNALGSRDREKTYRIIGYFQSNPKNNPLVMVVGTLFGFFAKIFQMHALRNAGDREVQKVLGLSTAYFVKDYRRAAQEYNKTQTEKVLNLLREYDLKSKGVERASATDQSLMQEMVYHILSC
ncbi:MAG: DNA polymerase III subunit delta [Saprospiraceae bacterium]|nr:DNA polymerase III subunit delta [Saprospiraceae bacterium]